MDEMKIFSNPEFGQIRVIQKERDSWFVAKDVCDVLEISNSRDAINRLDMDEVDSTDIIDNLGRRQTATTINEYGLYSLILGSRKPEAKKFKRWITHEVIPSIRKHGGYLTPEKLQEALNDPDVIIQLATRLKQEQEERRLLAKKVEQDRPKVIFADALEVSSSTILIGELAKLLNQNGVNIGQNRLFEKLRNEGYLIRQKGESWNTPTQRAMDMGIFKIKKSVINNPDGSNRTTTTTKVTGKGQQFFVNKFLRSEQLI